MSRATALLAALLALLAAAPVEAADYAGPLIDAHSPSGESRR